MAAPTLYPARHICHSRIGYLVMRKLLTAERCEITREEAAEIEVAVRRRAAKYDKAEAARRKEKRRVKEERA